MISIMQMILIFKSRQFSNFVCSIGVILVLGHKSLGADPVASYKAALEIFENGKIVARPTLVLIEKKASKTIQTVKIGRLEIELLAVQGKMSGKDGVILSFIVSKLERSGVKTRISEPGVLAQFGEAALANIGPKGNESSLQVSVVLKK